MTIFLIVAPVAVFCVYVARKLIDDFSDHLGISVVTVVVVFTIYVRFSLFLSHTLKHNLFLLPYIVQLHWYGTLFITLRVPTHTHLFEVKLEAGIWFPNEI